MPVHPYSGVIGRQILAVLVLRKALTIISSYNAIILIPFYVLNRNILSIK